MALRLDKDLLTGVDEIDTQHERLVSTARQLIDLTLAKKGYGEIGAIIAALQEYARDHFATEEKYMALNDYPGATKHLSKHREFFQDLEVIANRFRREGPSADLADMMRLRVVEWFIRHIKNDDRAFGDFLRTRRR